MAGAIDEIPLQGRLQRVLRAMVRPVAVVTAERDSVRYAMTATAFAEVSMEPPSMLVSIHRRNATFRAIADGADFGLNLLSEHQAEVCRQCSTIAAGETKFEVGNWVVHPGLPPLLSDCCAAMVLRPVRMVDQGTHSVVIGEVIDLAHVGDLAPLAWHQGHFLLPLAAQTPRRGAGAVPEGSWPGR